MNGAPSSSGARAVRIAAPGRLHLGFLDLGGSLGRRFGSLGLALDWPRLDVTVARADADSAEGPDARRAAAARDRIREALGITEPFAITVAEALPAHGGLGSGTQLALAVGVAVARLSGRTLMPAEIAAHLGRGLRSAIGLGAFGQGGFILDGGKPYPPAPGDAPPPVIARLPVPESWRILLAFDDAASGLSGDAETKAMEALPSFPQALAAHLCHLVLMRALPGLAEGDAARFGAAIGEIQRHLGDHYAGAQGGGRYASGDVAEAMAYLEAEGVAGVGQSSWGPTGFAVVDGAAHAESLLETLRARFSGRAHLAFACVKANNKGAEISDL